MDPVVFIIIAVVVLVLMVKGIVRTFQSNWLAALVLMIFGFSGLILWYLPKHKKFKRKFSRMFT